MNNQKAKLLAETAWLKYYNQVLFEQGIITEELKNKMINKINLRT